MQRSTSSMETSGASESPGRFHLGVTDGTWISVALKGGLEGGLKAGA